ncbi:MAG: methyltransferase domain-containing protein [Candidatus Eisenbacteria sp.]|nr:methyltransferase domain-containing protein [Candidatus Eisenbacteria bacterium]
MDTIALLRHDGIRVQPRYYDIAFANRDLEVECGFLEYLSRNLGRGKLDAFLEVGCGPGYHMHRLASLGVRSYGVESSPEMVAYAEEKAIAVASGQQRSISLQAVPVGSNGPSAETQAATILLADLQDFSLPEAVDLAFCPHSAFCYLLRNEDVITHLVTVAKNLGRGGLYVIEGEHPASLFNCGSSCPCEWEVEQNGVLVKVRVGNENTSVDPITQLLDLEIALDVTDGNKVTRIRDNAPVRLFAYHELRALVKLSGVFDWVTTFGDLSITQPFDLSSGARYMVPILRCSV